MSIFSKRLKLLRKEKNITQSDLARAINKSRPTVAAYEIDERLPDIETIKTICEYFNVSIDYMLGHNFNKNENMENLYQAYINSDDNIKEAINKLLELG